MRTGHRHDLHQPRAEETDTVNRRSGRQTLDDAERAPSLSTLPADDDEATHQVWAVLTARGVDDPDRAIRPWHVVWLGDDLAPDSRCPHCANEGRQPDVCLGTFEHAWRYAQAVAHEVPAVEVAVFTVPTGLARMETVLAVENLRAAQH